MRQKLFNPFLLSCAAGALLFQLLGFARYGFHGDFRLVIFLVLLLMNAHYQVISIPHKRSVSVNFPLLFPIIVSFGPAWASLFASIGLISVDEFEDDWPVFLFNRGSLGLASGLSALVFFAVGGQDNLAVSLTSALLAYTFTNHFLYFLAGYFCGRQVQIPSLVLNSLKTLLPSAALSALFFAAFQRFDIFESLVPILSL